MDLPTGRAKCDGCGALFSLASHLGERPKHQPEKPKSIELETDFSDTITYVRRWYSPAAFGLLFFCVLWNGFMVVWFGIAIAQEQWMMAAFGSIHGAMGVGVAYMTLAGFRNRSYLRISPDHVIVEQKPFPMMRRREVEIGAIRQIYVKERVQKGKNGVSRTYTLHYLGHDGKSHKLAMLNTPEEGWYLEMEIEKLLGIADQPMIDEHRPPQ